MICMRGACGQGIAEFCFSGADMTRIFGFMIRKQLGNQFFKGASHAGFIATSR